MSNSAVFFVPAARSCARVVALPCLVSPPRLRCRRRRCGGRARRHLGDSGRSGPLMRGGRSADRRTRLFCSVARARRDHRASAARHRPVASGTPLGAPPWRFSAGDPRRRLRQWDTGAASELSAPGHEAWRTGSRTSRSCGSRRRRGTPLPAPPAGSSPETPLRSEDANVLSQLRYVVNSAVVSQSKFFACSGCESLAAGPPAAPFASGTAPLL
jgi:hypothetical protein